jgi:hypothetical protein
VKADDGRGGRCFRFLFVEGDMRLDLSDMFLGYTIDSVVYSDYRRLRRGINWLQVVG